MKVTFTRIAERRYSISVEGPNIVPVMMKHGPGYHPRLPHDAAHFIVENALGITGGIFGQIAAGGTGGTFLPEDAKKGKKTRKRGRKLAKANEKDALFSEHAIWAAQSRWEKHEIIPDTKIPLADLDRIIEQFEAFAAKWTKVQVGGSVTLEWRHGGAARRKR